MQHKQLYLLLISIILTLSFASAALAAEPIPIEFTKTGGGQWIYCNNPEFINIYNTSTIENSYATYMMKNTGLKPGKYSVFFCFYNWTNSDLEPDVEFVSSSNAQVTINKVGYYVPWGDSHMDCIGAWSDYLNLNIRSLDGVRQYVPFTGDNGLPKTITLNNSSDWISPYIYNYQAIRPMWCFNMLVDFTIDSGEVDVNFAAPKSFGELSDRRFQDPYAAPGYYINDSSVKGIDIETLPMVETNLNIKIDNTCKNGENIPVKVFNQYYNKGNVTTQWMTNINPSKDAYIDSKKSAASSDMLSLQYKDDLKLDLYGKDVPEKDKNNIWYFDIYHNNTKAYEEGMPGKADNHIPNAFTSKTLSIDKKPNPKYELNLGNFGVTYRYHLDIKNSDAVDRFVNYFIEGALSSNLVIARDEKGNVLNPYTHEKENPYAISRAAIATKKVDCVFSAQLKPNQSKKYIVDVILPTNCYGGIMNSINIDNHKSLTEPESTEFPVFSQLYPYKNVFYTGQEHMKWEDGRLYKLNNNGAWENVKLPTFSRSLLSSYGTEFSIKRTSGGYAARFDGWDNAGKREGYNKENKVYLFDDSFNYLNTIEFPTYIYGMENTFEGLYVNADATYVSKNNQPFDKVVEEDAHSFPVSNGEYTIIEKSGDEYIGSDAHQYNKVVYESGGAKDIQSADSIFYYKKSWKESYNNDKKQNIISISKDGLYWTDITLPDKYLDLMQVNYINNKLYIDCYYENYVFTPSLPDSIKTVLDSEYLVFDTKPKKINDRVMVPLRFFFENLQAKVTWHDQAQLIQVNKNGTTITLQIGNTTAVINGEQVKLDSPPYLDDEKTLIPLRFLSENLGYDVEWDETKQLATILSK